MDRVQRNHTDSPGLIIRGLDLTLPCLICFPPTYQRAADPLKVGGGHGELVELNVKQSMDQSSGAELKFTTRQDPSTYPWACICWSA